MLRSTDYSWIPSVISNLLSPMISPPPTKLFSDSSSTQVSHLLMFSQPRFEFSKSLTPPILRSTDHAWILSVSSSLPSPMTSPPRTKLISDFPSTQGFSRSLMISHPRSKFSKPLTRSIVRSINHFWIHPVQGQSTTYQTLLRFFLHPRFSRLLAFSHRDPNSPNL